MYHTPQVHVLEILYDINASHSNNRLPPLKRVKYINPPPRVHYIQYHANTAIKQNHTTTSSYTTSGMRSHIHMTAANPHRSGIVDAIIRPLPSSVKISWYHPTAIPPRPCRIALLVYWAVWNRRA